MKWNHTSPMLALLAILLLVGCDDSTSPEDLIGGRIHGTVENPDGPVGSQHVYAQEVGREEGVNSAQARTDSLGRFEIPLVPGAYELACAGGYYGATGLVPSMGDAAVLAVEDGKAVDPVVLRFGAILIEIAGTVPGPERLTLMLMVDGGRWKETAARLTDGVYLFDIDLVPPGVYAAEFSVSHDMDVRIPLEIGGEVVDRIEVFPLERTTALGVLPEATTVVMPLLSGTLNTFPSASYRLRLDDREGELLEIHDFGAGEEARFSTYEEEPFHLQWWGDADPFDGFDHRVDRWHGGYDPSSAIVVVPSPGQVVELAAFEEVSLVVRFELPESIETIDARVYLEHGSRDIESWSLYRTSGSRGLKTYLVGMAPGSYRLRLVPGSPGTVIDQRFSLDGSPDDESFWELTGAGTQREIEWRLSEGGVLLGAVRTAQGAPVAGAEMVIASAEPDSAPVVHAASTVDGTFRVAAVGKGMWRLGARVGGTTWWYPGTTDPDTAEPISITDYGEFDGFDITVF